MRIRALRALDRPLNDRVARPARDFEHWAGAAQQPHVGAYPVQPLGNRVHRVDKTRVGAGKLPAASLKTTHDEPQCAIVPADSGA